MAPIPGLPPYTEQLFRILAGVPSLSPFVLVGGTAMALQCRHRLSEDLDLWLPEGRLTERGIRPALEAAHNAGLDWRLTYPTESQSSTFRIQRGLFEGTRLEDRLREYEVGGVKLQFFAPEEHERDAFGPHAVSALHRTGEMPFETSFGIMPLDGIFAMKAYAIQRRHRTRDVLDLWHFVRAGKRIDEIISAAQQVASTATAERAVAVLRGDWPADEEDEGFHSLAPEVTLRQIRDDFCAWTDAYEQERARHAVRGG